MSVPEGQLRRCGAVIEAKDGEIAALRVALGLRADLEAEHELVCRLELGR
jgi:hypothetical protein